MDTAPLFYAMFLLILFTLAIPLGRYIAKVYQGEGTPLDSLFKPVERFIFRLIGIDPAHEMGWVEYTASLLVFSLLGWAFVFLLQLTQGYLPLNPQRLGATTPHLAFNTAVSFMTNTNWQSYGGETTLSYLVQMLGLTVQNFVSAASGMAVAVALIRGLMRQQARTIGNFWVDLTRTTLWILLPLSLVLAFLLVSQGIIQNLNPYTQVHTLEGSEQLVVMGPVASQEAIKMLGTNGGGFFNANSAHPFENPTPLSNLLETLSILLIPTALVFTFGRMVGDKRQGYVILAAMLILFILALGTCYYSEAIGIPGVRSLAISGPTALEGKEVRFGIDKSVLWATATTAASNGAVNSMHESFTPIGSLVPLFLIMLGEVVFGGVGSGLYGMLVFVILAVFIVGLMVGRTPEYLGKKIESGEMRMAVLAVLLPSVTILIGSAAAVSTQVGVSSVLNPGPHGLSEILYAFSSAAGNNGSAFAGLNANTPFYNLALGAAMLIGRFGVILPVLAIAGSMAAKKSVPIGRGTFRTTSILFTAVLIGTIIIIGALTFFPALALGPIVEQFIMNQGGSF